MSTLGAEGKLHAALLLSDCNNSEMVDALRIRLAEKINDTTRVETELEAIVAGAKLMDTIVTITISSLYYIKNCSNVAFLRV